MKIYPSTTIKKAVFSHVPSINLLYKSCIRFMSHPLILQFYLIIAMARVWLNKPKARG